MDNRLYEVEPALTKGEVQHSRDGQYIPGSTRYTNVLSEEFLVRIANMDYEPWQSDAACVGQQAIMFAHQGERKQEKVRREAAAKEICQSCLVLKTCLEYAIAGDERGAIWGGLNDEERRQLKADRNAS